MVTITSNSGVVTGDSGEYTITYGGYKAGALMFLFDVDIGTASIIEFNIAIKFANYDDYYNLSKLVGSSLEVDAFEVTASGRYAYPLSLPFNIESISLNVSVSSSAECSVNVDMEEA